MAEFTYPLNDFDRPAALLNVVGSFWSTIYQGSGLVSDYTAVTGQTAQQAYREILELIQSASRFDVPLYHKEDWYPVVLLESEVTRQEEPLAYGEPVNYGDNYVYGQSVRRQYFYANKPADLAQASYMFDRLTAPTVSLEVGTDVVIEADRLVFLENPFSYPTVVARDIVDSRGNIVDRETTFWLYAGKFDWKTVYEQFGYALELDIQTSEAYKRFLNVIFDGLVGGTSAAIQRWAIAAALGVPVVQEVKEQVLEIRADVRDLTIVTDFHTYQYPPGTTPLVHEGDVLPAGAFLTDTLQLFEFIAGVVPPVEQLPALTMAPGMLAFGYWHGVTFENKMVPVTVEPDVDGYTKISWPLGGFSLDVEKFWADTHAAGVAKGQTLAMLMDQRPSPVGQPFAECLPAYVNPLEFLIKNYLRGNAFVVKVRPGSVRRNALSFVPVTCLQKIHPPHTAMLFVFELVQRDAAIIMEESGSPSAPGYSESLSGFPCLPYEETLDPVALVTETVTARTIFGRCV